MPNQHLLRTVSAALALAAMAALPRAALASEGQLFGGPVGGTDLRNAYLPGPGTYVGLVAAASNATASYGANGEKVPGLQVGGQAFATAAALMYVYPTEVLGGRIASTIQLALYDGNLKLNGHDNPFRGFGDIYSDLLAWSRTFSAPGNAPVNPRLPYGMTVKVAYSMIFPTGKYNTHDTLTPGHNDYFYIPNAAVSYLTGPNALGDGLELSAHLFIDVAGLNSKTDYKTGTVADLDFAVSERRGPWQAGIAGFYGDQLQNDTRSGVTVAPDGKRLLTFGLGPIAVYDVPAWKSSFKLKLQFPVEMHNTLEQTRLFLSMIRAF